MNSPLATPRATIETLQRAGLYTKKRLGQHFLIDDNVIGRILNAAALAPTDIVLEVGPGIGTLTIALLDRAAQVLAIEKDSQLLDVLTPTTDSNPRLTVINADALDLPTLDLPVAPTELVANLPYQVAATVVLDCFEHIPSIQRATVMVQREVAERMAAQPGTKAYGAYTAKLALLAHPVNSFPVSRQSFLPPPRVDSTVITLDRRADGECVQTPAHYRAVADLIDAAFANRRKTIYNNLRQRGEGSSEGSTEDLVKDALQQAGINPQARAETLTPSDFIRLSSIL